MWYEWAPQPLPDASDRAALIFAYQFPRRLFTSFVSAFCDKYTHFKTQPTAASSSPL